MPRGKKKKKTARRPSLSPPLSPLRPRHARPQKRKKDGKKKPPHLPDFRVKVLPPRVLFFLEHLPDVFDDKLPLGQIHLGEEAKALGAGALGLERGALLASKALVAAVLVVAGARGAVARDALEVERPVDAGLAAAPPNDAGRGRRIRGQRGAGAEHDVVLVELLGVAVDVDVLGDELPDGRAALGRGGGGRGAAAGFGRGESGGGGLPR